VQTYLKERIREVLTRCRPSDRRPHLRTGFDVLRDKAEEVRTALADIPDSSPAQGVDVGSAAHSGNVKLDQAQVRSEAGDVRRASATLMAGEEVGDIFIGGRTYDVHVWTAPEFRRSIDSVARC